MITVLDTKILYIAGYHVTAPDLIGHGLSPSSPNYSIQSFANALLPLLTTDHTFDLIIAHSLGVLITLTALPNFKFSGRMVLVDPPLEIGAGKPMQETRRENVDCVVNIKSINAYIEDGCTETDAIWRIAGLRLCKPEVVNAVFDVSLFPLQCHHTCNNPLLPIQDNSDTPWSFTNRIPNNSSSSPDSQIVILGADPAVGAMFTPADAEAMKVSHPHVITKVVKFAPHTMMLDQKSRDAVLYEALDLWPATLEPEKQAKSWMSFFWQ